MFVHISHIAPLNNLNKSTSRFNLVVLSKKLKKQKCSLRIKEVQINATSLSYSGEF